MEYSFSIKPKFIPSFTDAMGERGEERDTLYVTLNHPKLGSVIHEFSYIKEFCERYRNLHFLFRPSDGDVDAAMKAVEKILKEGDEMNAKLTKQYIDQQLNTQ